MWALTKLIRDETEAETMEKRKKRGIVGEVATLKSFTSRALTSKRQRDCRALIISRLFSNFSAFQCVMNIDGIHKK